MHQSPASGAMVGDSRLSCCVPVPRHVPVPRVTSQLLTSHCLFDSILRLSLFCSLSASCLLPVACLFLSLILCSLGFEIRWNEFYLILSSGGDGVTQLVER